MKHIYEKSVEPLRMLPKFDSKATFNEVHSEQIPSSKFIDRSHSLLSDSSVYHNEINESRFDKNFLIQQAMSHLQSTSLLLPRFHSDHRRFFHNENQSAGVTMKMESQTKINTKKTKEINYDPNAFDL